MSLTEWLLIVLIMLQVLGIILLVLGWPRYGKVDRWKVAQALSHAMSEETKGETLSQEFINRWVAFKYGELCVATGLPPSEVKYYQAEVGRLHRDAFTLVATDGNLYP